MNIELVNSSNMSEFISWVLDRFERAKPVSVDIETTGLSPWLNEMRTVQFGSADEAYVVPVGLDDETLGLVLNIGGPWIFHNAKFDAQFIQKRFCVDVLDGWWDDTQLFVSIHDPAVKGLKDIAYAYLGETYTEAATILKRFMQQNKFGWGDVPVEAPEFYTYAGMDAILTSRIWETLTDRYPKTKLYEIEKCCTKVLRSAEWHGMQLDLDYIEKFRLELEEAINELLPTIEVNPFSPKQVVEALNVKGFDVTSSSKDVLEKVDDDLARKVLQARTLNKQKASYFDNILKMQAGGVVHPMINQNGAITGRMSCAFPNMQNVPRGNFIRGMIIPRPGHKLLSLDYEQIEYRLFAAAASQEQMLEAFRNDKDLHTETAKKIFGVEEPTEEQRSIAKNTNFALLYGAGVKKLAKMTKTSEEEMKRFLLEHEGAFPGAQAFIRTMAAIGAKEGYITTFGGRRVPIPPQKPYVATNYLIQGSAADILKLALTRLGRWSNAFRLPIHDELVFEVKDEEVDEAQEEIARIMRLEDVDTGVPLAVDCKVQDRWG